jgi:hypothetical protein
MQLTRTHRILIGVVVTGAILIAAIGFAGSYAAVRDLAETKGFGEFSYFFPIGIDAGICVLLALDLLLTWMRIPFPLLRQSAWLLTTATIAFNGAAAWPDPLGVGMHAVIPLLFIVSVEAARHAVGRIADITADKHMEGVRLTRWLLAPLPTFKLWRRMKLWELRSYEQVIKIEQDRLIYQSRLQARFGRNWKRKAPIEALMPLRLAKFGVPLADTAPAGLAAAGIEPMLLPPGAVAAAPVLAELPQVRDGIPEPRPGLPHPGEARPDQARPDQARSDQAVRPEAQRQTPWEQRPQPERLQKRPPEREQAKEQELPQDQRGVPAAEVAQPQEQPQRQEQYPQQLQQAQQPQWRAAEDSATAPAPVSPWFATPQVPTGGYEGAYDPTRDEGLEPAPASSPAATEATPVTAPAPAPAPAPPPAPTPPPSRNRRPLGRPRGQTFQQQPYSETQRMDQVQDQNQPAELPDDQPVSGLPDDISREEAYFSAFRKYVSENGDFPGPRQFGGYLMDLYGITGRDGAPLSEGSLKPYLKDFGTRYQTDLDNEYIA